MSCSTPQTILIGAGGHAKVVLEAISAYAGLNVVGVLDRVQHGAMILGIPVIGDDDMLPQLRAAGVVAAVVALGENSLRDKIGHKLIELGFWLPTIIHPSAQLSPSASVAQGAVIMARACIGPLASVGALAIVNTGSIVEHDNAIGRAAHIAPGVALAGSVIVGDRALVGVGSAVRPGIVIGNDAIVGAGSAVVSDVPPGTVVCGVPARRLGFRPASA